MLTGGTSEADLPYHVQMEDRVEDLLQAGVLDPAKVTRSGLMNACGIAGIMLTTQVCSVALFLQHLS